MKTLSEIIDDIKDGKNPAYDELKYAVLALDALSFFDKNALKNLFIGEEQNKKKILTYSIKWQYDESFNRWKLAYNKNPKTYVGWNNDPSNPEYLKSRKNNIKIVNKILNK